MKLFNYILSTICTVCACLSAEAQDDKPEFKEPFYVNPATIKIKAEPDDDKAIGVTPVHEGLWAREFPDGYQFYDLQGLKFTDSRWKYGASTAPRMTQWGMMVKKADAGHKDPYFLVKRDGSQTPLPANWEAPTQFVDGLAITGVRDGYNLSYHYITPDLKIAYPNLNPMPQRFEDENYATPPLAEGLRAYCTKVDGWSLWGYIDSNGKVVIEPQFTNARSFHCGLALVTDKNGRKYFINKNGEKAYGKDWESYDNVSDYDSGFCAAPGEKFDQTDYYDVLGNKVKTMKNGSPFRNGYGYCFIFNKELNKDEVHKIDTGFSDLGTVNVTTGDYNAPWYDEAGVAHFNSRIADGAPGNGMYFFDYTLGPYSKEGYAPATMVTNDAKTIYTGFVDKQGHFRLLYSTYTK